MFHYQVLKHSAELEGMDRKAFCAEVGMRPSFAAEFTKMINLARVIKDQGSRLV